MNKSVLLLLFCFNISSHAMQQPVHLYKDGKTEHLKLLLNAFQTSYTLQQEKEACQLILEGADPNVCVDSGLNKGHSFLTLWELYLLRNPTTNHNFLAFLLNNGANPNRGWTIMSPLMRACVYDDYAGAALFIAAGANVIAMNSKGQTALTFALGDPTRPKFYKAALVKLLLNHGAGVCIELENVEGESPMRTARKGKLGDIVAIFEAYKSKI